MLFHIQLVCSSIVLRKEKSHAYKQDQGYRNEQSQKPERSHDNPKELHNIWSQYPLRFIVNGTGS